MEDILNRIAEAEEDLAGAFSEKDIEALELELEMLYDRLSEIES